MLQTSKAIVLRSVRFGESSLVCTLFTENWGIQSYLVQGVRKSGATQKAGLLHTCAQLEIVSDQRPLKNLLRLGEFHPSFIYQQLPESVLRNSVGLFAMEFLWRLLPEQAVFPELFAFTQHTLQWLDEMEEHHLGIMPLYFSTRAAALAGYEIYDAQNKVLIPELQLSGEEIEAMLQLVRASRERDLLDIQLPLAIRKSLLHKHLHFLHHMVSNMQHLKSLPVLEMILHP